MKKQTVAAVVAGAMALATLPYTPIYASEFEGNESEWLSKCSVAQSSEAEAEQCRQFKEYYAQKTSDLDASIASMQETRNQLAEDLSNIQQLIAELDAQIEGLNTQISDYGANIATMQANIAELDIKMAEKQAEMEQLDAQIKLRMESEQVNIGTNRYIDVLMGANDLMDMIQLIEGINLITENDQEQIDEAALMRQEYELQQQEQQRLAEDVEVQLAKTEELKEAAETGKSEQKKLYNEFYEKEQEVKREMETAQANADDMAGALANINTNVRDDIFQKPADDTGNGAENGNTGGETGGTSGGTVSGNGNTSFIKPISYALYAGTWYYPSDPWDTRLYEHIGADYSGPVGGAVVAPARSIVLYANDPYGSTQYGSTLGWPRGGANTIELLTQVNGTTYAISFFHLSKGILVSPGDVVEQGQVVAYSGASGNVTGPHLHVELINLGNMSITEAQARFAVRADFGWGSGWSVSSACSIRGNTPCRERPEEFFGY